MFTKLSNQTKTSLIVLTTYVFFGVTAPAYAESASYEPLSTEAVVIRADSITLPEETKANLKGTVYGSDDQDEVKQEHSVPTKSKRHGFFQKLFSVFGGVFESDDFGYDGPYLFVS